MFIGIDFGTCYSNLEVCTKKDGRLVLGRPLCGDRGCPTMMRYDSENDEFVFGDDCEKDYYDHVDDTIVKLKLKIRGLAKDNPSSANPDKNTATSCGKTLTYSAWLRKYLAWLLTSAISRACMRGIIDNNEPIEGITVTVPCGLDSNAVTKAAYGSILQDGINDAIDELQKSYENLIVAGIRGECGNNIPISIKNEPVAAAIAYAQDRPVKSGSNILVVDLGGGTFDATIVKYTRENDQAKYDIIDTDGDLQLGGDDWDKALLEYIEKKLKIKFTDDAAGRNKEIIALQQARLCKESLSDRESYIWQFDKKRLEVTRNDFEKETKVLLKRVKSVISRLVDRNGGISKIDTIVMVGGGCLMPQIKDGIKELYPKFDNINMYDASRAIAMGAAYNAAMERDKSYSVTDIADANYGFTMSVAVNYKDINGRDYFTTTDEKGKTHYYIKHIQNVIFKGDKRDEPKYASGGYSPLTNTQQAIGFSIYESDPKACEDVGIARKDQRNPIELSPHRKIFNDKGLTFSVDVPDEYQGKARKFGVKVQMTLTSDGTIELKAWDNSSGEELEVIRTEE